MADSQPRVCVRARMLTWWGRAALPLGTLHHLFGHALGAALLPLLLHQLLKLRLAGVDAALIGGAAHHRLQHGHRRCHGALPDLRQRPVCGLRTLLTSPQQRLSLSAVHKEGCTYSLRVRHRYRLQAQRSGYNNAF